jgi:hypothetical protein
MNSNNTNINVCYFIINYIYYHNIILTMHSNINLLLVNIIIGWLVNIYNLIVNILYI